MTSSILTKDDAAVGGALSENWSCCLYKTCDRPWKQTHNIPSAKRKQCSRKKSLTRNKQFPVFANCAVDAEGLPIIEFFVGEGASCLND